MPVISDPCWSRGKLRLPVIQTVLVQKEVEVPIIQTVIVERKEEVPTLQTVIVEKEVTAGSRKGHRQGGDRTHTDGNA